MRSQTASSHQRWFTDQLLHGSNELAMVVLAFGYALRSTESRRLMRASHIRWMLFRAMQQSEIGNCFRFTSVQGAVVDMINQMTFSARMLVCSKGEKLQCTLPCGYTPVVFYAKRGRRPTPTCTSLHDRVFGDDYCVLRKAWPKAKHVVDTVYQLVFFFLANLKLLGQASCLFDFMRYL